MRKRTWAVPAAIAAVAGAASVLWHNERARWRALDEAQRLRRKMRQARAVRGRRRRRAAGRRVQGHFH